MDDLKPEYIAYVLAAVIVMAGFVLGPVSGYLHPNQDQEAAVGEPGSEHLHAYLFFVVNGSKKSLDPSYIERSARVHFHHDDNIIHVEAENVDLGYALETLGVRVNSTCLEFGLESEVICGGRGSSGVKINGETQDFKTALDRDIRQGDSIVVWFGEEPQGFERELPPAYRETAPGRSV